MQWLIQGVSHQARSVHSFVVYRAPASGTRHAGKDCLLPDAAVVLLRPISKRATMRALGLADVTLGEVSDMSL